MKTDSKNFPPATLRTLQILDLFMADPAPKTLKTISAQLDIPFTSAYRIVMCMQEFRYLVEDPVIPNHFRLGYKMACFADIAFTEKALFQIAMPFMKRIADDLNQASQLCILTDDGVSIIGQCLPRETICYIAELHRSIPINVSAAGKLLASLLPVKEQLQFLKKAEPRFTKNTSHTITDRGVFRAHLAATAARGYGTDDEEFAPGIGCVAVPIYISASQKPVAALGTTGSIDYYHRKEDLDKILVCLNETARKIGDSFFT